MAIRIIPKSQQAHGAFNGGQIIENKPVGFPQDGGFVRPFSTLFYWARAEGVIDSTIGLHPHQGFEIMSFVLEGNIRHYDTKNDMWKPLEKGDVQIIRAGGGIQHAEHLEKGAVIFQIWVDPDLSKSLAKPASYDDYKVDSFPRSKSDTAHRTTFIGEGSPLELDTELVAEKLLLSGKEDYSVGEESIGAFYILSGSGNIGGQGVEQDDFIIVEDLPSVELFPNEEMEVFAIKLPVDPGYRTYAQRAAQVGQS